MIPPEKDITSLTRHPQWRNLAAFINSVEATEIKALRTSIDAVSNRHLIFITRLKTELLMRSENKDLFNV